jgi:transaldolase/glucose-6-phosphate isomerase
MEPMECLDLHLGDYQECVLHRLEIWQSEGLSRRIWERDPTAWFPEPRPEIVDRLGWLDLPGTMPAIISDLEEFTTQVQADGLERVVLLGMGGSSLAPEVFAATFGAADGHPGLTVLDSTHPSAVQALVDTIDLARTLFLVSSKSGTTLETLSFFRCFWERVSAVLGEAGSRFVAITDPGSSLAELGAARGFRAVFKAPPDVGGRYSALSPFGLVPAALLGIDLPELLARARWMVSRTAPKVVESHNPGLRVGATIGELALRGLDKLTFLAPAGLRSYPAWLEQLVAESLGKDGHGIIPVADEPRRAPEDYLHDRVFVLFEQQDAPDEELSGFASALVREGHPLIRNRLGDRYDLSASMFCWEFAVASAGSLLQVHPFDQPSVQLAKKLAEQAMAGQVPAGPIPAVGLSDSKEAGQALRGLLDSVLPGDYLAVQAFLAPQPDVTDRLQRLRHALGSRLRVTTTLGYGPRFLHSTGQLHKGGPGSVICLQLVDDPEKEVPVPETDYGFGRIVRAQADGDIQALQQRERRVLRVDLGGDPLAGLDRLAELDLL